jgi:AcrR family transcriptional regulator
MDAEPTIAAAPGAAPMRERIIDVALDLFARQGYGGTSLRNIAERLGVSKAAIYYHFHTKDDIARVVADRALDARGNMTDRLVVAGTDPQAWQRALVQVIDIALSNRQLLFVLERNEDMFHAIFANDPGIIGRMSRLDAEADQLFGSETVDPETRVWLGCTLGAILGPLVMLSGHYQDISDEQLRLYLRKAVSALVADV